MKIAITVPASAVPRSGNQHTAARWARFLRGMRHRVRIVKEWRGGHDDLLLALHARKSAASIQRFSDRRPAAPIVVALTGTDLYRDIRTSAEARQSLGLATRLAVLQDEGLRELSPFLRGKTRVVYQSSDTTLRHAPEKSCFRVAVIGHLREEKDPFRAVMALRRIARDTPVEVVQLGAALNREMRVRARGWAKIERRYRWLGSVPHRTAMRWLASSHVLVVSSVMEGGANVICEAARIGVPVLASRVPGNVGMLGRDYPGYFSLFDDRSLARLIERCRTHAPFYKKLRNALLRRRALFAPSAERASLKHLLQGLSASSRRTKPNRR
ncbi:MAG TPA: selenoneine biosynthesis selenosugar synthase SenB [Gemmatimonadales bacterium]|nr:selenoneine biosynthesis selenosugar synthase SenB [Gemmatimonadales bacterium]